MPALNTEAWASLKLKPNVLEPILQEMEKEFQDINWVVTG